MNENISYFIGVLHTDASIYVFHNKKRDSVQHRFRLEVGEKSLPMLKKTRRILKFEFNRNLKVYFEGKNEYGTKMFCLQTSINKLLPLFKELKIDKHTVPSYILSDTKLFGAYLAGLIDGDGDVCIKRPKYPQCRIKITSEHKSHLLIDMIRKHMNSGAWIEKTYGYVTLPRGKVVKPNAFRHCFYLSPKNVQNFMKFVYPHIQIFHKKLIIEKFLLNEF